MDDKLKIFSDLYINDIINGDGAMSKDLLLLFDDILVNDLNEDHVKMDQIIENIIKENTEEILDENQILKERIEMLEDTILEIADLALN